MKHMSLALSADADEYLDIVPIAGHHPKVVLRTADASIHFASIEDARTWAHRIVDLANDPKWWTAFDIPSHTTLDEEYP